MACLSFHSKHCPLASGLRKQDFVRGKKKTIGTPSTSRGCVRSRSTVGAARFSLVDVAAAVIGAGLVALLGKAYARRSTERTHAQSTPAAFVGSRACASCHAEQAADWGKSQHRAAMATANDRPCSATSTTREVHVRRHDHRVLPDATASSSCAPTDRTASSPTSR